MLGFSFGGKGGGATDSGDSIYSNDELLGAYKDLTYEECRDIYRYWPLGKRVATALPNFAMSSGRTFSVKENLPEVIKALEEAEKLLKIPQVVNKAAVYSRVYGLSFVYLASDSSECPPDKPLNREEFLHSSCRFNVLDPLSAGGSIQIDNDSLSPTFGLPLYLKVKGKVVNSSRIHLCFNDIPLYYKFNPSSFSFGGPSIYQNMTLLIRSWNRTVLALQRLSTKAASIIVKRKDGSGTAGFQVQALNRNLSAIRSLENDGITSIRVGEEIEFFNLAGLSEIDSICNRLNSMLMMALSDTPSGILLDKNLSTGLADGDNDMKAIIISTDRFRKDILKPIYDFLDKFMCYRAFTPELISEMKEKYPELYRDKSEESILMEWLDSYSFEFNELYPQSENEKEDTSSKKLDNLLKLKELGAEVSGLEEAINLSEVCKGVDIVLHEQQEGEHLEDEDDESSSIQPSAPEAPKGIDSREKS